MVTMWLGDASLVNLAKDSLPQGTFDIRCKGIGDQGGQIYVMLYILLYVQKSPSNIDKIACYF